MEREYGSNSQNSDYKMRYLLFLMEKGMLFQKNSIDEITVENSDVQLETLMNHLKSMLISYSRFFEAYSIKEEAIFKEDVRKMGYRGRIEIMRVGEETKDSSQEKPDSACEWIIDVETIEDIHDFVKELSLKSNDLAPWDQDDKTAKLLIWPKVLNQLQLYVGTKKEEVKGLIAIWESINYMQEYYIPLYIRMKENVVTGYWKESFSKKFYDEVQKILKKDVQGTINKDSYFRTLVLNQMERSGREYYNIIAKKGKRDDE